MCARFMGKGICKIFCQRREYWCASCQVFLLFARTNFVLLLMVSMYFLEQGSVSQGAEAGGRRQAGAHSPLHPDVAPHAQEIRTWSWKGCKSSDSTPIFWPGDLHNVQAGEKPRPTSHSHPGNRRQALRQRSTWGACVRTLVPRVSYFVNDKISKWSCYVFPLLKQPCSIPFSKAEYPECSARQWQTDGQALCDTPNGSCIAKALSLCFPACPFVVHHYLSLLHIRVKNMDYCSWSFQNLENPGNLNLLHVINI